MPRGKLVDDLTLGPARRRRSMHHRLRELDRRGARHRRRLAGLLRELARRLAVAATTAAVVGSVGLVVAHRQFGVTVGLHGIHRLRPLGTPPVVPHGLGSLAFLQHQPGRPGTPVGYDPCRPMHLEVNDALAPAGGDRILGDAIAEVSAATGLRIVVDGRTDRQPDRFRDQNSMLRSGSQRSPGLVAWTTPDRVPVLRGAVAGVGGSAAHTDPISGDRYFVTGTVALDAPDLSEVLTRPHGRAEVRAVVLHELGHLVGLDHVHDPGELMNQHNLGLLDFGPGDREGLAALGSGRCFP